MANYKRGRPRTVGAHNCCDGSKYNQPPDWRWRSSYPRWHDIVFHRRPHRRRVRVAIVQVMQGRDPDAILWPVSKKPHTYYW